MFLKRERPEKDDFAIKKYLEKFLVEISIIQEKKSFGRHRYKKKSMHILAFQEYSVPFSFFSKQKLSFS